MVSFLCHYWVKQLVQKNSLKAHILHEWTWNLFFIPPAEGSPSVPRLLNHSKCVIRGTARFRCFNQSAFERCPFLLNSQLHISLLTPPRRSASTNSTGSNICCIQKTCVRTLVQSGGKAGEELKQTEARTKANTDWTDWKERR